MSRVETREKNASSLASTIDRGAVEPLLDGSREAQPSGRASTARIVSPSRLDDGTRSLGAGTTGGRAPPLGPLSFGVLVVAPAVAWFLYLVLVAAPQFVSEARFVVRGSVERLAIEGIGQGAQLSAFTNTQEAHVVAAFVRSPELVERLDSRYDLRAHFSKPRLDVLHRLDPDASTDALVRLWRRMVGAEVDATTGIVTVTVRAFDAATAPVLAQAILDESASFVAALTERMRSVRVGEALAERDAARADMADLLAALQAARAREDAIDPLAAATALTDLVAALREERARLSSARSSVAARVDSAPSLALLEENIRSIDAQIDALLALATEQDPDRPDLVEAVGVFDMLEARRELAVTRVAEAEHALTAARLAALRQNAVLEVFVPPTRGYLSVSPRPLESAAILLVALATLWGIAALYGDAVRSRVR